MMMNYYIPWKNLTVADHDVRRGLKIIFSIVYRLSPGCDNELLHSLKKSDSCMPWCTPWIEIIFSIVSKVNTMIYICLPIVSRDVHILEIMDAMMYAVDWNYIPLSPKWIQWYTSVCRLSPGCDNELLHSLKKIWLVNTMMYAVDWKLYSSIVSKVNTMIYICLPLSPEMWWFHFGHRDIRG